MSYDVGCMMGGMLGGLLVEIVNNNENIFGWSLGFGTKKISAVPKQYSIGYESKSIISVRFCFKD